jgi:tetratricopeptide (TPR) repeat protein
LSLYHYITAFVEDYQVKKKHFLTVSLALILLVGASGCGFLNKVKAKDNLNKAAQFFNQGNYDEALKLLEEALELDPTLKNLKPYYGATLYAKYNLGGDEQFLHKALDVYLEIYQEETQKASPDAETLGNTVAYIAVIYDNMGDAEKKLEWTKKRLEIPGLAPRDQAEIYYTLGANVWQDCYQITQKYIVNRPPEPTYNVPEEEASKVRDMAQKGLEYLNKAVSLSPEYPEPWSYIGLLDRELAKLEKDSQKKQQLIKEADQAKDKYLELKKREQQQKQESPPQEGS